MQKRNWKFKKAVNNLFFKLKKKPKLIKLMTNVIFYVRFLSRMGRASKPDNLGGVMFNDTYKLLCVTNPKVGSSSLKMFFQHQLPESEFHLGTPYFSFIRSNPDKLSYMKIAFVRPSCLRIYSCWQDKICNNQRFADMFIITRFKGLYPDMPFDEFIDWLCSDAGSDKYADRHWLSQHKLLDVDSNKNNFDLIDDISNMNHQFEKIIEKLNIQDVKLIERNKSGKAEHSYSFTKDVMEKIALRYAEDIKLFGFSRPTQ